MRAVRRQAFEEQLRSSSSSSSLLSSSSSSSPSSSAPSIVPSGLRQGVSFGFFFFVRTCVDGQPRSVLFADDGGREGDLEGLILGFVLGFEGDSRPPLEPPLSVVLSAEVEESSLTVGGLRSCELGSLIGALRAGSWGSTAMLARAKARVAALV
jgi:hypothetical protein